jgi:hypothetical protein
MKCKQVRALILFFLFTTLHMGCISVQMGPKKPEPARGVSFQAPGKPFVEISPPGADSAWQDKGSGNTISFSSTCHDSGDPSLDSIQSDLVGELDNPHILQSEHLTFNDRDALHSQVEGTVEGVKTRLELLVFKKNDCIYSLSYVAVSKSFATNQAQFKEFQTSFKAP